MRPPPCGLQIRDEGVCWELLDRLQEAEVKDAAGVMKLISAHVQPLPVLRATLAAARRAAGSAVGSVLEQVLCSVDAEHLFAGRKVPRKVVKASGFVPVLRQFPDFQSARQTGPLIVIGQLSVFWCQDVQLSQVSREARKFGAIEPELVADASGLFAVVPFPPIPAIPFWRPSPSSIRICRRHVVWCWQLLETIRVAVSLACSCLP